VPVAENNETILIPQSRGGVQKKRLQKFGREYVPGKMRRKTTKTKASGIKGRRIDGLAAHRSRLNRINSRQGR